jgi:hypothetical protein
MASSAAEKVDTAKSYDYATLAKLGGLQHVDEVKVVVAKLVPAQRAEAASNENFEAAQTGDARRRPERIREARHAQLDCADTSAALVRELAAARSEVFARVTPVIRAEHQRMLEELRPVLEQAVQICDRIIAVEAVAGRFSYHASSNAGLGRSPIAGECGGLIKERILFWLGTVLPWHR